MVVNTKSVFSEKPAKDCERPCGKLREIRLNAANDPSIVCVSCVSAAFRTGLNAGQIIANAYTALNTELSLNWS